MALLIAVSTALLFASAPCTSWALERGGDDESISVSLHDVPAISRQQESPERSARRDDEDSVLGPFDDLLLVEERVFAAWPLPAPSTLHRSRRVGGQYARGPPMAS
ncbi:hypothetical protein [Nannocystis radixulma]|uniref:Secreted protein n=1 Tax=Nannocystis radixulma TaxID=2995305 RepID=A0ABT5BCN4_9BACT|nr:hypothetical protein [Nannocystis radixulma]MDC0671876.1 hypothetical protein [Nannocystis radixulma]